MSTEAVILTILGLLCSVTGLILFTTAPVEPPGAPAAPAAQVVGVAAGESEPSAPIVVPALAVPVVPQPVPVLPEPASAPPPEEVEDVTPAEPEDDEPEILDEAAFAGGEGLEEIKAPLSVEESFVEWHRRLGADPARAWRLADDTDRIRHKHAGLPAPVGRVARLLDIVEYEAPELYAADDGREALLEFLRIALGPDTRLLWPEVGDLAVGAVSANGMTGTVSSLVRPGFIHLDEAGAEHRVQPVVNRGRA